MQTILTARGGGRGENISLPEHGEPCMDLEWKAASFHTFLFCFVSLRTIFCVLLLFKLLFFFFSCMLDYLGSTLLVRCVPDKDSVVF